MEQAGLEMIQLATEMINKKQFTDAIDILVNIRRNMAHIRKLTSLQVAFIGLERFKDVEIFAHGFT